MHVNEFQHHQSRQNMQGLITLLGIGQNMQGLITLLGIGTDQ